MKAALFDLDGVLIDTEGIYSGFWSRMGEEYGAGVENFSDVIKGTTLVNILNTYFPKDKHGEICDRLHEFEDTMEYRIFPGVEEYLDWLDSQGIPAVIVTSSGDAKMQRLWQQHPGFRQRFAAIVTDSMVERSKPDPQGYMIAASLVGANPVDCCVFEDSLNGLEAGRRSRAKVIGLATTNGRDMLAGRADIIVDSLADPVLRTL